jgi:hypothetical protein
MLIACLPTSSENRKSRDTALRFLQLAREIKRQGCKDEFILTGDLSRWNLPDCPDVIRTGFVEYLADLMGRCKAVCMLSPLGYGFKTTIADALAAGAHMIVHPSLARRSPRLVRPFLLELKSNSARDVSALADRLCLAPDAMRLHEQLLDQAWAVMADCFGRKAGRPTQAEVVMDQEMT